VFVRTLRLPFHATIGEFLFSNDQIVLAAGDGEWWRLSLDDTTLSRIVPGKESFVMEQPHAVSDVPISLKVQKRLTYSTLDLLARSHSTNSGEEFMFFFSFELRTVYKVDALMRVRSMYTLVEGRSVVKMEVSTDGKCVLLAIERGTAILLKENSSGQMVPDGTFGKRESLTISVAWTSASFSYLFDSNTTAAGTTPSQGREHCLLTTSHDSDYAIRHTCYLWSTQNQDSACSTLTGAPNIKLPMKEQIIAVAACVDSPVIVAVDLKGNAWFWRQRMTSDFPGPMYPPGFTLMHFVEHTHEQEDALDLEVYDANSEEAKQIVFPKDRKATRLEHFYSDKRLAKAYPVAVEPEDVDVGTFTRASSKRPGLSLKRILNNEKVCAHVFAADVLRAVCHSMCVLTIDAYRRSTETVMGRTSKSIPFHFRHTRTVRTVESRLSFPSLRVYFKEISTPS
jgi:hypothetical protein